jgi:RNA polymerase sigma-70 factor, ECF subfamily
LAPVYAGARSRRGLQSPAVKSRHPQGEPVETIVEQLRDDARREESFRLLFDRFYWPLFRFFEGRGFSSEECQDLVQETFLRVHRGIADFRGDARWERWLFRIAANTAVKALRHGAAAKRAGRTVPLEESDAEGAPLAAAAEDPGGAAPAPLARLLDKERKELLSRAVDGLPAQMRRCVRLRVFQDLDYDEIAEVLQISPSTVKVQLFKARKRLQVELEDSLTDFDL